MGIQTDQQKSNEKEKSCKIFSKEETGKRKQRKKEEKYIEEGWVRDIIKEE